MPLGIGRLTLAFCLLLLFLASCAVLPGILTHRGMRHSDLEAHFTNKTTTLADSIQPLAVKCPVCKQEGFYIQSIYAQSAVPGTTNILYSQYVCTNSHEWLIRQTMVGGSVLPGALLLK